MSTRYFFYAIMLVVIGLMVWVTIDTFTQPGIGELDVKFEEVASYRNENNTGPITRLYAVYAPDTAWHAMKKYGDFMPHSKYGNTKVFFFDKKEFTPRSLSPADPVFDPALQPYCVAIYEKPAMSDAALIRFPYR